MLQNEDSITSLKANIKGTVLTADDAEYEARRVTMFNHDAKPAVVVMCTSADDVAAALAYAREHKLVISLRSGGHNGAGLSTNNGGIVIDVSAINSVEVVDADKRLVRVGAGAKWGDVAKSLEPQGLALTSGDTRSVGVAGLTLGGGIGWMVRKYGMAVDNLVSVDIVTVDGKLLHASADENSDLFWAVRGAGANFGVAITFEFIAQPVTNIYGGAINFDFAERSTVLKGWASYMRTAPRELTTTINMMGSFMPGMPDSLTLGVCYAGDNKAEADAAIAPLLQLGKVLSNTIEKKPYGDMLESAMPLGDMKVFTHNGFAPKLSDELMDTIVATFAKKGAPIVQIRSLGGAVDDTSKDAMAFCHRGNEGFVLTPIFHTPDTPEETAFKIADGVWAPLKPFIDGAYCNFFTDTRLSTLVESFPEDVYKRLTEIKAIYDPENLLHLNANVEPARR
jgi:FAD/FMN-containing dehydrogenase